MWFIKRKEKTEPDEVKKSQIIIGNLRFQFPLEPVDGNYKAIKIGERLMELPFDLTYSSITDFIIDAQTSSAIIEYGKEHKKQLVNIKSLSDKWYILEPNDNGEE
jgi:hypothetical protein